MATKYIEADKVEKITWEEPSYYDPLNVLTEVRDKVRELPAADVVPVAFKGFAEWVADWILRGCFEECAGGFAELACRRLEDLGIMRKDEHYWVRNEVEE